MNSTRGNRRIAVAVALGAAMAQGGSAVADDVPSADGLGRIACTGGALTLDPADTAHLVRVGRAGTPEDSAPGWDTTGVPGEAVAGDTVRWSLTGVDGPGEVKVYDAEDAEPVFDSSDGQPDVRRLPVGARGDTRWEFSEDGTYQVIFSAEATAADGHELSVGTVYTVVVGDTAPADAPSAAEQEEKAAEVAETAETAEVPAAEQSPAATRTAKTATSATLTATNDSGGATSEQAASEKAVSEKKVLDNGHIDFAARVVDGKLQIHLKDGTVAGKTTWREPSSVVLHVKSAAKNTIPDNDEFAFLGKADAPVWLLDQVQQEGLLWPGWSTDNITAGATAAGVTFSLAAVDGPGAYALYTYDAMSGADVLFNSGDGVPDSFDVAPNTHAHGGWAFTAQGTYRLTFKMSGKLADGTAVSDTETVTFVVGDTDPSTVSPGDGSDQDSTGSSGTSGSGSGSGSGSTDGSAPDDSDGSMASTGAGDAVLVGGSAAALTAAGALSVLAARRRRTARD